MQKAIYWTYCISLLFFYILIGYPVVFVLLSNKKLQCI